MTFRFTQALQTISYTRQMRRSTQICIANTTELSRHDLPFHIHASIQGQANCTCGISTHSSTPPNHVPNAPSDGLPNSAPHLCPTPNALNTFPHHSPYPSPASSQTFHLPLTPHTLPNLVPLPVPRAPSRITPKPVSLLLDVVDKRCGGGTRLGIV